MKKTCFLFSAILLFSTACSLKKTAEDTAKTTKEMNETTKEMNESTKELKGTSSDLKERTEALESQMTFDVSHTRMMEHLDRLFAESARDNRVNKSAKNNEPDLFAEAGFVIQAMYFQFWKGQSGEDVAELDDRLEIGTELLFDRLFKHVPRNARVDVWLPDTSYKGVAALGAKLDEVHSRYTKGLERRGLPRMTYYDYIIQALRNRDAMVRTEITPKAAAKILQWEPEVVYTLQLRHNILPVMVLARITDFQDTNTVMRAWNWLVGQKVDLSNTNPEQLKEWTAWLNKASKTRKDLRSIGIEPEYNKFLNDLVAGVDFGQDEMIANTQPTAHQMLLRDFAVAYKRVVSEASPN